MVIVEGVEHHLSRAALAHESCASQESQLMRDRGFAEPQDVGDVADTEFGTGEHVEDAHARGIAQDLEGVGQGTDEFGVEQAGLEILNI